MSQKNSGIGALVAVGIIAAGIGYAVGVSIKGSGSPSANTETAGQEAVVDTGETVEQLSEKLSAVMMPQEEYEKLTAAIYQTGLTLLTSRAQSSGLEVDPSIGEDLKKIVSEKYTRDYFTKMNASAMTGLEKTDLFQIIKFYETDAGKKFLSLSPKIIANTMTTVRDDMAAWIPQTVETLMEKVKENQPKKADGQKEAPKKPGSANKS